MMLLPLTSAVPGDADCKMRLKKATAVATATGTGERQAGQSRAA